MSKKETDLLCSMSDQLENFFSKNDSIIAKIYGVFKFKMSWGRTIYLMVMKNSVQKVYESSQLVLKFDLKGSTINRGVIKKKFKR